jgi:cbb3-type cytochrome oxidase subunit 3
MDNYIGDVKYLVTIGLIVMAIISIIAGNKYNFKNFRIYGLSLIFLSAAKLLVFDFSSSGLGAVGMLLAGILCLCVVFIYNKGNKGDTKGE